MGIMMRFLGFFIALRFKQGRRHASLVSLISFVSTFSIALGMIVLIVGLSAMNGFERELRQRILSVIPHAEFSVVNEAMSDWESVAEALENEPHILSAAPYVSFTGLLENGSKLNAVFVKGVDVNREKKISILPKYVPKNEWRQFEQSSDTILIGKGLAERLRVKTGDWLTLLIPEKEQNHQLKSPKRVRIQVAGILTLSGTLGNKFAFIHLAAAQQYAHLGDSVSGVAVNVDNPLNAYLYAKQAAEKSVLPLNVNSWEYDSGYMYRDIQMIRSIMYLAMILVIGISCFSIVSTLIIAVKDKQSDIAILKTLGASDRLILGIFLSYGGMSGLIGSGIGALSGMLIALNLSPLMAFIETLLGHKFLDGHIYFIDFMPSELHISDVAVVFITTLLLSLVASYYPARRACRVDPAKILSYN